jgi:hypothetical protein
MRKATLAAVVAVGLAAPAAAQAQTMEIITGGVLGGLAGSIYVSGVQATAATVGTAAVWTATAVGAAVPVVTTAVAGAVATASAPVIIGVVGGAALGYLLLK